MDFEKELEYAKLIGLDLDLVKATEELKSDLEKKGLYERDTTNVLASAQNILEEKCESIVSQHLIDGKKKGGSLNKAYLQLQRVGCLKF